MPFVIEKEIDPFYKEGVKRGLQKGIPKERLTIAKTLLRLHDEKTVSQIVKLPLEEVKKLKNTH